MPGPLPSSGPFPIKFEEAGAAVRSGNDGDVGFRHRARGQGDRSNGRVGTEYHAECDHRRGDGGPRVPRGSLVCRLGVVRHVGGEACECRCSDQQAPQQGAGGLLARRRLLGWRCVWRCVQGQSRRERRWGRCGRASRHRGGQRWQPGGRCRSRVGQVRECSGVRGWGTVGGQGGAVCSSSVVVSSPPVVAPGAAAVPVSFGSLSSL